MTKLPRGEAAMKRKQRTIADNKFVRNTDGSVSIVNIYDDYSVPIEIARVDLEAVARFILDGISDEADDADTKETGVQ
jgi:hypothetical protein